MAVDSVENLAMLRQGWRPTLSHPKFSGSKSMLRHLETLVEVWHRRGFLETLVEVWNRGGWGARSGKEESPQLRFWNRGTVVPEQAAKNYLVLSSESNMNDSDREKKLWDEWKVDRNEHSWQESRVRNSAGELLHLKKNESHTSATRELFNIGYYGG